MLSITSISLICCCLLAIVSAAPLEHGHHHHEKPIHQENDIKHIDNHHKTGTKPAGNNNIYVLAPKIEAGILPSGKGSPKSPKSPKAYDPEKVARAAAGKVYGEKLRKMPKKKSPKPTNKNGNNSIMQKEWAIKLADLWQSDELIKANVEPMHDNSIEKYLKHDSNTISVY